MFTFLMDGDALLLYSVGGHADMLFDCTATYGQLINKLMHAYSETGCNGNLKDGQ